MKALRILSLGIFAILINCTVEDIGGAFDSIANPHYDNKFYFSPAEWTQGVWYADDNNKLEFTDNDVIFSAYNSYRWNSTSMNRQLNEISFGTNNRKLIEEIATDSSYSFKIGSVNGDSSINYLFQKISSDSMLHTRSSYNDSWKYGRRY